MVCFLVCYFIILILLQKFRLFSVKFVNDRISEYNFNEKNFDKELLLKKFKLFLKYKNQHTDLDSVRNIESYDLIKMIAIACPFSVSEKQLLLESKNINILAKKNHRLKRWRLTLFALAGFI